MAATQFSARLSMIHVALVALITVVLAILAVDTTPHGRLAEAKSS